MAVKIRLRRMGKKKQPIYKIVAADSRSPRDGKFLEAIGLYNPLTNPSTIDIQEDRALYWLGVGAQPTETVKSLLSKTGILLKKEYQKRGLAEIEIEAKMADWQKLNEVKAPKFKTGKTTVKPAAGIEEHEKETDTTTEVQSTTSEEKPAE